MMGRRCRAKTLQQPRDVAVGDDAQPTQLPEQLGSLLELLPQLAHASIKLGVHQHDVSGELLTFSRTALTLLLGGRSLGGLLAQLVG